MALPNGRSRAAVSAVGRVDVEVAVVPRTRLSIMGRDLVEEGSDLGCYEGRIS